ncbi:MAG TPA: hypothetical protein VK470_15855, partial [Bacteroidota bacterium]|nr:hypothetical protein [Bacteroidota bacterium]
MKRIRSCILALIIISFAGSARADEVVFKGTLGLITYVKKNIHLLDTVNVGTTSYLRYSALEGTVQLPLSDVIEIRFIPYDVTEVAVTQTISDTIAVPILSLMGTVPRKVVNVSSIAALKSALLDNTVDEIVMANGRYTISASSSQTTNSLWIGPEYASRTRPILVRAKTRGAVVFDANGGSIGGMTFVGGAHDQTWDGFSFANGVVSSTGVFVIGGYIDTPALAEPVHHITLRYINI